ncbi:MAG: ATP-binding cassette domain-containing protein, partial [Verrucomicrobia bacterium]|nr:ATP-binding cassette domain-containing protein [Verrucomicrobiota bacterium]
MTGSERTSATGPVLAVEAISKSYPGVQALRNVSFGCERGEIHGLVGENGAGKTTLMRVLAGVIQPDSGIVRVRGEVVVLTSPRRAHDLGIAMVYQDTRLVDNLDVAQNIWLGREPGSAFFVDRRQTERDSRSLLENLGLQVELRQQVQRLSAAQRQTIEIARALTAKPAVLILDEPTSALDLGEVTQLKATLRVLQRNGTGIIFISHRLPEVLALSKRITVMRDGEVVTTLLNENLTEDVLVNKMVGRNLSLTFPKRSQTTGRILFEVRNLCSAKYFRGITFKVSAGEIIGLGGIQGNGQREVARSVFGLLPTTGEIYLDGSLVRWRSPAEAIRAGVVFVPADRRLESLFPPHSIRNNIAAAHLNVWSRFGILDPQLERNLVRATIDRFKIRTPSVDQPVAFLSGGNQQKVVIGRWVISDPKLYVFDEPTQGVDVATKLELYRVIRDLAGRGAAIILLSSDLLELIGLSDRILVVSRGVIVDSVPSVDATEERIVGSAVSQKAGFGVPDTPRSRRMLGSRAPLLRRYGNVLLLLVLMLSVVFYTCSKSKYFLTERNLGSLLLQLVPLAFASIGQMMVILLGGIDLSVGPVISLTTALASYFLLPGLEPFGIFLCMLAGLIIGGTNAILILASKIPDLISTLSTYSIVFGLALLVRPSPGGHVSEAFSDLITARLGWVPTITLVVIMLVLLGEWLLVKSRVGIHFYAAGARPEAAYLCGIPVTRLRFVSYLFS